MRGTMRLRDYRASMLVAGLSGAFGVVLLQGTSVLTTSISLTSAGSAGMTRMLTSFVVLVFFGIAVYVSSVVTANTVATVIAGRIREIALYRLIGSDAARLRKTIALEGLVCAAIGSIAGAIIGSIGMWIAVGMALRSGALAPAEYVLIEPVLLLPIIATILLGWLASWSGSRRVLHVTPIEALGVEVTAEEGTRPRTRRVWSIILGVLGLGLLALAVFAGQFTAGAVLIGLVGGILSFSGVIAASTVVMPALLAGTGWMLGTGPAGRIASANSTRHPERSARAMIGLVIGITLVSMFAVASATFVTMMERMSAEHPDQAPAIDEGLTVVLGIFSVLFGFSAVIAAVGMVNNLSLSVIQRRRELGLLRTLGFTRAQLRSMIVAESTQMSVVAVVFGLALGTVYGWCGAQALLGSVWGGGIITPTIPPVMVLGILVLAVMLALGAALAPSRRAMRLSPVEAMSVD